MGLYKENLAGYNKIMLAGVVASEPEFIMGTDRDSLNIKLLINRKDIGKEEYVTVKIMEDDLINKAVDEIKVGDYFITVAARLITQIYTKISPIICQNCQNLEYKQNQAEKTEIEVLEYEIMEVKEPETAVGINKVFLLGNVCKELNFREGANNGKDYVKYKLAVNRSKKNSSVQNADYPFIVSFGNEATSASKHLHVGDLILVEGAVQEREIVQRHQYYCPECGEESTSKAKSIVREIITLKCEYLSKKIEVEE